MNAPRKYEGDLIERLACDVANAWGRFRLHEPRLVDRMDPHLVRKLDEFDGLTRGDGRRCVCLTGRDSRGVRHDLRCPAFKPG